MVRILWSIHDPLERLGVSVPFRKLEGPDWWLNFQLSEVWGNDLVGTTFLISKDCVVGYILDEFGLAYGHFFW